MSSPKMMSIEVSIDTFHRLQCLARPFTDSPDSVITKLLDYYEKGQERPPAKLFRSFLTKDGVNIPLGKIVGTYRPRGHDNKYELIATVTERGIEFEGKIFDDLSPAAKYAKMTVGASDSAAQTNGWIFWKHLDPESEKYTLLDEYRKRERLDNLTLEDLGL